MVAVPRRWQVVDTLAYGVAVAVLSFLSGVVISLPFGLSWYVVEAVMFLEGWLLFGYGTLKLRPTPPWKRNMDGVRGRVHDALSTSETASGPRPDTRVESLVNRVPGLGERVPPPDRRLPMGAKVFVAGIVVLASSFLLELAVIA